MLLGEPSNRGGKDDRQDGDNRPEQEEDECCSGIRRGAHEIANTSCIGDKNEQSPDEADHASQNALRYEVRGYRFGGLVLFHAKQKTARMPRFREAYSRAASSTNIIA